MRADAFLDDSPAKDTKATPQSASSFLDAESFLDTEGAASTQDPQPSAPKYDTFSEATGKSLDNVPERMQQSFGGMVQMLGEDMGQERERYMAQSAQKLGITPQEYKLLAWAGNEGLVQKDASIPDALASLKERMITELTPEQQSQVADMGLINPDKVASAGERIRRDAQDTMKPVNAEPGSAAYYGSAAIGSIAEMTPALLASALTRNPAIGMSIIGTQVGGQSYGQGRDQGLSVNEAQRYAVAQAAAEAIPEYLPIATILKPGTNFFGKMAKTGIAESVQEMITSALQAGIDKGMIKPDMTWGQARQQIIDGGIIGLIAGPGMAAMMEPLVRSGNKQDQKNQDAPSAPKDAAPDANDGQATPAENKGTEAEQTAPQDWTDAVLAEDFLDGQDAAPADDNTPVNDYKGRPEWATDQTNIFRDGMQAETQSDPQPATQPEPNTSPMPEAEQTPGAPTESGTGVFRVPVDQIKVDPEQYQFRSRVNEQGVDNRLDGVKKWDDRRAGSVLLHRRKNGDLYVADGHHRVDLAKRLNQGEINAQIINETDGVDVSAARVDAAMNNIADGKAEALDVAKVFRDSDVPTQEVRDTFNLPSNQVVRDGESLSKLTDNVFGMVTASQLTEKDGAAIGSAFTEQAQQEAAADAFQKVQPDTEYQRQLLINEIRAADFAQSQGKQEGLFGDDPQEVSLMQDRLKVLDSLRQRLNSDKRLFKSLNDNADRAGEAGNQIATEANESITKQSARTLDLIGRVTTTPALNEMVNRAARRVYDGESRSKVVAELKQELMNYEAGTDAAVSRPARQPQSREPAVETGQEQRAGKRVPEQDAAGTDQKGQPEGEVTPFLNLESQTEEQLAEQARTREAADKAEADQRQQEEQRTRADEQVDGFALTGSNQSADVAMAAGQEDLLAQAAAETDINPTDGQKEAGNYKKGKVRIQGMEIAIENPKGSTRSGTDPDGNRWESTMAHHYGDIKGTTAADGDNLDVFIGPDPNIDQVFVIDQPNADGSFDEHKIMLGFANEKAAREGYLANYEDGWKVGPITRMTTDELKTWMREGDTTKPVAGEPTAEQQPKAAEDAPEQDNEQPNTKQADNLPPRDRDTARTDTGADSEGNGKAARSDGSQKQEVEAAPEITWKKDGKRKVWRSSDGQIITDESFGVGGSRVRFFPVYANDAERNSGNNYASGETLTEAKSKAALQPEGARYSFAGQRAEIAEQYDLFRAKEMLNDGADAEAVRKETGWFKGKDGKWRFEINDSDARYLPFVNKTAGKLWTENLEDVLDHPKLFAAYPNLRTLEVVSARGMGGLNGSFNEETGQIMINAEKGAAEQFSTLMHEIQHGIQSIEGFARGGNSDSVAYMVRQELLSKASERGDTRLISQYKTALREYSLVSKAKTIVDFRNITQPRQIFNSSYWYEHSDQIRDVFGIPPKRGPALRQYAEDAGHWIANRLEREGGYDVNKILSKHNLSRFRSTGQDQDGRKALNNEYRKVERKFHKIDREQLQQAYATQEEIEKLQFVPQSEAQDLYRRLYGEIESRNVQARQSMTEQERRDTPPEATQDTASSEAIVIMHGKRMSNAPTPANVQSNRETDYLRAPAADPDTLTADQARSIESDLMQGWKGKPKVTMADSISEFPKDLRQAIRDAGAEGDMRAVFWRDEVFVLAPRIPGRAALEEVLLHEIVGHYGLRKMVGKELVPLLNNVYMQLGDSARARLIKRNYFPGNTFDPKNMNHRLTVAEELLAHLAETKQHQKLWKRIVAAIRDGLRKMGFKNRLTETDLLGILAGAQRTVERGGFQQPSDADINFSRSDSANPDIRFKRDGEGESSSERQVKFWDGFATQPLDRMFRALFDVTGTLDSHGRLKAGVKITEGSERILKEWRPNPKGHFAWMDGILETARHGLIDRYKLTDDYKMAWRQAEAYGRNLDMQAMDILKTLEERGVQGTEAAVLQKLLTGETVNDFQMEAVATPIRHAIDELGQAAVEYGVITREQFERNRGEYLHRSYLKHEGEFTGLGKFIHNQQRKQNRKIKGDTAKGRGIQIRVKTDKIMQHVPVGWYGVQKKGQKPDLQALTGQRFTMLENPGVINEATDTFEGVDVPEQRRATETVYWPTSQPLPAKYDAWRKRGTFEVRGARGDQVTLWRDYTKAEREHMGEILDARYNIAKTFQMLSRDLAMGKFFADVSQNDEWFQHDRPVDGEILSPSEARTLSALSKADWVEVPDTAVSGSAGTKQWGALAGGYVRAEIWRDLNELDKMHNPGMWRKILTQWKLNKTARSPVVHMNNVVSNFVLMDLADVRATDLYKGILSYKEKDQHWRAAQEYGAFEGTFINEEIRRQVLDPILEELTKQNMAADTSAEGTLQTLSRMGYILWTKVKKLDTAMTEFYQIEDEIFRMATYMRRLDLGDAPIDAARTAREQFLDYDIRAPWVNMARRTVMPFISYTYRATPVVAQSIIHRPWKLAKYFTLAYLANSMAYLLAPGDEDEERRTMRDDQQGMTWIGTPRMLRMPWKDEHGNPVFMDIRRWIPAGDVFDMNQGNSALPIPAPIQFGGPLMLGFEFALNKQAFTGEEIVSRDTDTTGEAVGKTADWLYKSWMPSAAYVPGSYYWEKFWKASDGARDILGRPYSVPQALLSSIGIKVQPHDVKLGYEFRSRDLAAQARTIKADMRRAESDRKRGIITQGEYLKIRSRAKKKMLRLKEQQDKLSGKD